MAQDQAVLIIADTVEEFNSCVNRCVAEQEDFLTEYAVHHCQTTPDGELSHFLLGSFTPYSVIDGRATSLELQRLGIEADII